MNNNNQAMWVGGVALLVVIVLGVWWITASQGMPLWGPYANTGENATSTESGSRGVVPSTSRASSDVLTVARSISSTGEFSALLSSTGVASEIRSTGQYTIFVPKDNVLSTAGLSAAQKKRLAQYHVISGRAIDPDAVIAGAVMTLSKDPINFTVNDDGSVSLGGTAKIVASYKAKNGVVFVIDHALVPPQKNPAF